jgi:hypothetical protein
VLGAVGAGRHHDRGGRRDDRPLLPRPWAEAPEVASPTRVETLLLSVLLTSIGTLAFILGLTGAICTSLGIG